MDTSNIKVGQKVAIQGNRYDRFTFDYTVIKVTATGQVVVAAPGLTPDTLGSTRRFDKRGREMGLSYGGCHLVVDVDVAREQVRVSKAKQAAAVAILKVSADVRHSIEAWSKEAMQAEVDRMQAALTAAQQAVNAIDTCAPSHGVV